MKYSGIDLHSNNSVVTVIDEEDRGVAEKRLPNDLTKILGVLLPWQKELAGVVVELMFNWYWLIDGLQAAGFTFIWPTPRQSKNTKGSSTVTTKLMRVTSPTCCVWESCRWGLFCRRPNAPCAI